MNFLSRFFEPSSHAGYAMLLQVAKTFFPQYGAIFDAATAFFSALAIGVTEKKASA